MLFRQLFDQQSSTFSYLLADQDTREAVLIDPVFEQLRREVALIKELDLRLLCSLETHVHADHVTGAWLLREALGSAITVPARAGASGADRELSDGELLCFGRHRLEVRATPGHTDGCTSYVLDEGRMVFTGDALLIRGCGRTDFQQGSAHALFHSVHERLFSLPDDCLVYPAHDYGGSCCSSIGEERRYNPRLGANVGEGDFVGYMANLHLAHPKQIDVAVPANRLCGKPGITAGSDVADDWAPIRRNFAGIPEIDADWVAEHRSELQIIDVREAQELNAELGHIEAAMHIPLGALAGHIATLPTQRPLVVVCRSGARSARAVQMLEQAGLKCVANLAGGMLRWRAQGLAVSGGGN